MNVTCNTVSQRHHVVPLLTDKKFLAFFFRRIKPNTSDRYQEEFPYISPCGPETNYIRCDDLPIVFTHLLDQDGHVIEDIFTYGQTDIESEGQQEDYRFLGNSDIDVKTTISQELCAQHDGVKSGTKRSTESLSYGGAGSSLTLPFQPEKLCMLPDSGRVYHTGPTLLGGVGLVKSSLALEFSRFFVYEEGVSESHPPVAFRWRGRTHTLDRSVLGLMGTAQM